MKKLFSGIRSRKKGGGGGGRRQPSQTTENLAPPLPSPPPPPPPVLRGTVPAPSKVSIDSAGATAGTKQQTVNTPSSMYRYAMQEYQNTVSPSDANDDGRSTGMGGMLGGRGTSTMGMRHPGNAGYAPYMHQQYHHTPQQVRKRRSSSSSTASRGKGLVQQQHQTYIPPKVLPMAEHGPRRKKPEVEGVADTEGASESSSENPNTETNAENDQPAGDETDLSVMEEARVTPQEESNVFSAHGLDPSSTKSLPGSSTRHHDPTTGDPGPIRTTASTTVEYDEGLMPVPLVESTSSSQSLDETIYGAHSYIEPAMPDATYEEYYGDAYVGAPIKYIYPSGYQSMRPRGGPWKLSIAIFTLFTWLSVFIVGHCSDRVDMSSYNVNGDEIDDDALVIETRWCGSRLLYFMWVVSVLITGLAMAYCSIIGYIKVRDFAVANCRSQPPGMVGKSDYYVRIDDNGPPPPPPPLPPRPGGGESPSYPSYQSQSSYRNSIYQSDGTPQFWGGHIYRPTQAAVAVTSR